MEIEIGTFKWDYFNEWFKEWMRSKNVFGSDFSVKMKKQQYNTRSKHFIYSTIKRRWFPEAWDLESQQGDSSGIFTTNILTLSDSWGESPLRFF